MLEQDRRQAGWSVGQAAWRLGVSIGEYRELEQPAAREAGTTLAGRATFRRLTANVERWNRGRLEGDAEEWTGGDG